MRTHKPAVLTAPLEHGDITASGCISIPELFPREIREAYDPESLVFQVVLYVSSGRPAIPLASGAKRPRADPSALRCLAGDGRFAVPGLVRAALRAHLQHYSVKPNGETLGKLAERTGAWATSGEA